MRDRESRIQTKRSGLEGEHMHLVWFACPGLPDAQTRRAYEAALAPLGEVTLQWIALAGLSGVFHGLGQSLRQNGRVLPQLIQRYPARGGAAPVSLSLVCFSAGYGLAFEVLQSVEDRAALDGLVLLDGLHTGYDADGTARDVGLFAFVEYARLAMAATACFTYGHTDVQTYGRYASTTETAAELVRLSGARAAGGEHDEDDFTTSVAHGRFVVRAYDRFDDLHQRQEHGAALTSWGPRIVADTLVAFLRRAAEPEPIPVPAPAPAPPASPPSGERGVLLRGSRGDDVAQLQSLLAIHVDGVFGVQTERAVRAFQLRHHLVVDGKVGPRTWAALEAARPGDQEEVSGIDVSHHQPAARFDWESIAADHRFVIARACYGRRVDGAFVEHARRAKAAGLHFGAYVFFRQRQPWQEQLDALARQLEGAGLGAGDIVPAIDLEANTDYDGPMDPAAHNGAGRALVEAVATRWGSALVYLAPGHWQELGRPAWVLEHAIWTAHWGVEQPVWPARWAIWQRSATHHHPGFPGGPLDLNRARRLPRIA
jgi:GH25 family lysozyme M1 (1,4-beta-N-acetylmuramidase)